ncbi:hypothetical protein BC829DRAFT_342029, partial [Chytridium lagenaria]
GSSRSPLLNSILQSIWRLARFHNVVLRFHHIPGKLNIEADAISREDSSGDYRISDATFSRLDLLWGPFDIDGMASRHNRRCRDFISRYFDPEAITTNFLSWSPPVFFPDPVLYLYPP